MILDLADSTAKVRWVWRSRLEVLGSPEPDVLSAFEDVACRYADGSRHYHTLHHIDCVLVELRHLSGTESHRPELELAVILHDVVYDSRAKDNEERSAEYAREVLAALGVDRPARDEVARLILLTRAHETTSDDRAGQILLDADLAILGYIQETYDWYAAAIRREFDWVSESDYRTGRRQVLERFLARPRLFCTPTAFEEYEPQARANLAREIFMLSRVPCHG